MDKPYVFVVDDDELVRQNIVKKLSRLQCRTLAFDSGEGLVEFLEKGNDEPDVILLDYKMGGMNGLETLRAVRKISPVPAVIFTAYEGLVDVKAVKKIGRCEVMLKTIDLNTLEYIVNGARAVRNLLNKDWVDSGKFRT